MKYLLLLHGTEGEMQTEMTPEEGAAMIAPWNAYWKEISDAGVFLAGEAVYPSSAATTVHNQPGGEVLVTDGPFADTKEQIGGFYLLECKDLDEALAWAKKVPVGEGSSVEVRPIMDFSAYGYEDADAATSATG